MKMDVFAAKVCAAIEKNLGNGVRVEVKKVKKNNGILLHGLYILSEEHTVVPTIYLEQFLEDYESGTSFDEIVNGLLNIYERNTPKRDIDMSFFGNYEAVKDRICYRLIGKQGNEFMLEKIPHMDFLDMVICFYYAYHGEGFGDGSILIYNSHVKMWNTSTEELFRLAQENTPRLFPWECNGIKDILNEITGTDEVFIPESETEADYPEIPMKVLSNEKKHYGAACILYPGVLEEITAEKENLYIIPSSIHETILLPYDRNKSTEDLKRIIYEVNRTQVAPEEVLSDSLYYYDIVRKEVVMA